MRPVWLSWALLLTSCATPLAPTRPLRWTPSLEQVKQLEAGLTRPLPRGELDAYRRVYAGQDNSIYGRLVPARAGGTGGIELTSSRQDLVAEGCLVEGPVDMPKAFEVKCYDAGGWTPTLAQIAELEKTLTFPEEVKLDKYSRSYAGVTRNGVREISGMAIWYGWWPEELSPEPAGVHIVDQSQLPYVSDGGCTVVEVSFNPATRKGHAECNGVT